MKKLSESIWANSIKRSNTEEIRTEDKTNNLKLLKPIDLGTSVLWADQDLKIFDDILFTFDEANDLIKNSGWRLPTIKEVAELDNVKPHHFSNGAYHIGDLTLPPNGLVRIASGSRLIDEHYYYAWTSEEYDLGSVHIFTMDDDNFYHSPVYNKRITDLVVQDRKDKLCVRLVKDK